MPCARLMRGRRSKLKTVAPSGGERTQRVLGLRGAEEAQRVAPCGRSATSAALGAFTLTTRPAPANAEAASEGDRARAAVKAALRSNAVLARTGLDADLPAGAGQLLDHVGHEGHAALAGSCPWTPNFTVALSSSLPPISP